MIASLPSMQLAAYVFGSFNALVCILMFFFVMRDHLPLLRRLALCVMMISAVAYLSLRVALLVQGVH